MESEILLGDCIIGMKKLQDNIADLIIADPPFAINFGPKISNQNRDKKLVLDGYNEIKKEDYAKFTNDWIVGAARILKAEGSMFVISGWTNLEAVLSSLRRANLETINHIIWKYNFGQCTKNRFVSSHYHILYACKANNKKRKFNSWCRFTQDEKNDSGRSLHYADKEDVWDIKKEYWRGVTKTPTKLPTALVKKIIEYTTDKNDLVFDPFMGSGTTAVVAKALQRKYFGFEIVPEYYNFIQERLSNK